MSQTCATLKVKPWGKGQGDYVEVNESDFDPAKHELLDAKAPEPEVDTDAQHDADGDGKLSVGEIRAALTAKGIEFDPKAKKADLRALLAASEA